MRTKFQMIQSRWLSDSLSQDKQAVLLARQPKGLRWADDLGLSVRPWRHSRRLECIQVVLNGKSL